MGPFHRPIDPPRCRCLHLGPLPLPFWPLPIELSHTYSSVTGSQSQRHWMVPLALPSGHRRTVPEYPPPPAAGPHHQMLSPGMLHTVHTPPLPAGVTGSPDAAACDAAHGAHAAAAGAQGQAAVAGLQLLVAGQLRLHRLPDLALRWRRRNWSQRARPGRAHAGRSQAALVAAGLPLRHQRRQRRPHLPLGVQEWLVGGACRGHDVGQRGRRLVADGHGRCGTRASCNCTVCPAARQPEQRRRLAESTPLWPALLRSREARRRPSSSLNDSCSS